jgi:hypothetical protein
VVAAPPVAVPSVAAAPPVPTPSAACWSRTAGDGPVRSFGAFFSAGGVVAVGAGAPVVVGAGAGAAVGAGLGCGALFAGFSVTIVQAPKKAIAEQAIIFKAMYVIPSLFRRRRS